jgi:glucose/arabinose dehydrogenase
MRKFLLPALVAALAIHPLAAIAQDDGDAPAAEEADEAPPPFFASPALGSGPWDFTTEKGTIFVEVVTRGLVRPWDITFLPDGDMLVTERPGRLRVIRGGQLDPVPIAGLPPILATGIGGLMDVVLHPDFENNRLLYISYTKPGEEVRGHATTAVLRARWDGGMELEEVEDIWIADAWYGKPPLPERCCGQGPPVGSYGGRIAFGADGKLYITSGDRNYGEMVQDPSKHFGKLVRINDDGSVPEDNPFTGQEGWKPDIWTTGHRNPNGLILNEKTGQLWESEFGPRGGDELNLIERGANYGWIDVTQGHHYDGTPAKGIKGVEGMTDPVVSWGPPSINPGGIDFYDGSRFPQWDGNLFMASMSRSLVRMELDGDSMVHQEKMLEGLKQRLRDVAMGPDGNLYVLTDEEAGALLRISPGL